MERQHGKKVHGFLEDRTCILPDHIIFIIFSFMTLRDAWRTCILSRRWRDLWREAMHTITDLFLDDVNVMGRDYKHETLRLRYQMSAAEKKMLHSLRVQFSRRVEQILQSHQTLSLASFRIRFNPDVNFFAEINRWIQTAIAKRANKFDINLSEFDSYRFVPRVDGLYTFPDELFSTETTPFVKYLSLNYCIWAPLKDFSSFEILTELRLKRVYISDKDIEHILLNCSYLERLSIISCWNLKDLKIVGAITVLIIAECSSLSKIEIDSATLTTFRFSGDPVGLSFRNVPQLINVAMYSMEKNIVTDISYALGSLSTDLPQIESLLLHAEAIEKNMIPARLPVFFNLKKLSLMVNLVKKSLFGFFTILHGAPNLERFELHLIFNKNRKRKVKKFKEPCATPFVHLKEVVLSGLVGTEDEIGFAMHLIGNAKAIRTVAILSKDSRYHYSTGVQVFDGASRYGWCYGADETPVNRRYIAGCIGELLKKVIPPSAQLIIDSVNGKLITGTREEIL